MGPVLWLSCLHCSAGDMLTRRRAETQSRAALKVWTVFGVSRIWGLSWLVVRTDRSAKGANEGGKNRLGAGQEEEEIRVGLNIKPSSMKGKIPHNVTQTTESTTDCVLLDILHKVDLFKGLMPHLFDFSIRPDATMSVFGPKQTAQEERKLYTCHLTFLHLTRHIHVLVPETVNGAKCATATSS